MSAQFPEVLVECKPDERLVKALGVHPRRIVHAGNKGEICNRLRRRRGCIAVIDEDPGSAPPAYLKALPCVDEQYRIRVLEDREQGHRILVLCPRLEDWILDVARRNSVRPKAYGLPEAPDDLHRVINERLPAFEKLIGDLQRCRELEFLRGLL